MASGRRYSIADFERTVKSGPFPGGPSLSYSKRILRGSERGLPRQRARGHREQEHRRRVPRRGSQTHAALVARAKRNFVRRVGAHSRNLYHFDALPALILRELAIATGAQIRARARMSAREYWEDYIDAADQQVLGRDVELRNPYWYQQVLGRVDENRNPYWYHGGGGEYALP
jgi:hypothetical protein